MELKFSLKTTCENVIASRCSGSSEVFEIDPKQHAYLLETKQINI